MRYNDWRKLAVHCDDLRTMQIDGFQDYVERVPGVAYMKPVMGEFRGHPVVERFDCLGFITRDDKRGKWDVLIYNTEREFEHLSDAERYLWNEHVKSECDMTRYRLIGVDEEGNVVTNVLCDDWSELVKQIERDLPDEEYNKRAIADLSRVGNRFHEFRHGHYAAFPLDD